MSRPPFFAFYPADFADDLNVESMTTLCVGAYVLLLCKAWQAEPPASLPNDDQVLSRLARVDAVTWAEIKDGVLRCFILGTDGRLHNKRLRQEYDKALKLMRARANAGKKGADGRWKGGDDGTPNGKRMAKPLAQQCATDGIQSQIQKKKEREREPPGDVRADVEILTPPRFEEVREAWAGIDGVDQPTFISGQLRRDCAAAGTRPLFCERWREAIEAVGRSDFLRGGGENGWRANLPWFFEDGNLENILNGNYENRTPTPRARAKPKAPSVTDRIAQRLTEYDQRSNRDAG